MYKLQIYIIIYMYNCIYKYINYKLYIHIYSSSWKYMCTGEINVVLQTGFHSLICTLQLCSSIICFPINFPFGHFLLPLTFPKTFIIYLFIYFLYPLLFFSLSFIFLIFLEKVSRRCMLTSIGAFLFLNFHLHHKSKEQ